MQSAKRDRGGSQPLLSRAASTATAPRPSPPPRTGAGPTWPGSGWPRSSSRRSPRDSPRRGSSSSTGCDAFPTSGNALRLHGLPSLACHPWDGVGFNNNQSLRFPLPPQGHHHLPDRLHGDLPDRADAVQVVRHHGEGAGDVQEGLKLLHRRASLRRPDETPGTHVPTGLLNSQIQL